MNLENQINTSIIIPQDSTLKEFITSHRESMRGSLVDALVWKDGNENLGKTRAGTYFREPERRELTRQVNLDV